MTAPVPFCDLERAHAPIRAEIDRAIARCLDRSSFLRGPETAAFEEEWAASCGQAHAVCCNSGTDALSLAAMALGLRTAAVPANTLPLTATGLHHGGSSVRIADIRPDGWIASSAPDAVPVLIFGRTPPPGVPEALLYDAAHAHGWRPPAGSLAAWSFYPTKSLGALGDAGAVTTNDASLAEEMRHLCGRDDQFHNRRQITSRIDEMQAAVLRVKLRFLGRWLEERRGIAARYIERLEPLGLTLEGPSFHHLFVIRTAGRDRLAAHLQARGIGCKVHWAHPLHQLPGPWSAPDPCESAEAWCGSVLSLPCFPGLRPDEIGRVCDVVEEWCDRELPAGM